MKAIFYNFTKKENSTKQPDIAGTEYEVYLKSNTSIENPTFLIEGINLSFNYCYVQELSRYYFINDIVLGNNSIYEVSCVTDLLATYKTDIGNYTAFVERSSSNYNLNINDNCVSATQSVVTTRTANTSISWINPASGCYALRVIGRDGTIRSYTRVYLSDFQNIFNPDIVTSLLDADVKELGALMFDASSYVVGAYWLPMAWADLPATEQRDIYIKYYNTGVRGLPISGFREIIDLTINTPQAYYTDFRAYNPNFTRYQLYLPSVGVVPVSSELVAKGLSVDIRLDMQNGVMVYCLKAGGNMISSYEGNLFTSIPLVNTSSDFKNTISSAVSTLGSIASGNIPLATASAVNTASNVLTSTPSVTGAYQSAAMIVMHPDIELTAIVNGSGDKPSTVAGIPLFSNKKINTLSGFIKCGGASVDISGLATDRTTINSFLNTGFYFE